MQSDYTWEKNMIDNTIHISSMLRTFRAALGHVMETASGGSFEAVLGKAAADQLAGYKAAFEQKINQLPMDPSHTQDDVFIDISEEGWEAMQKDPSYEAWVLDTIRAQLSFKDPFASISGGCVVHLKFGASPEQYRGDSWRKGSTDLGEFMGTDKKKSYWEERKERADREREINDKIAEARANARAAAQRARARGEDTSLPDDASAAPEILAILLASYMQGL